VLTHCALVNFKGFRNLEIDLGRVNLFIGPNGSGKSSVGQALLILKQSPGSSINLGGPYFRATSFDEVLRFGAESAMVHIGLSASIDTRELGVSPDFMKDVALFTAAFDFERGNMRRCTTEISVKNARLAAQWDRYEGNPQNTFDIEGVRFGYSATSNVNPSIQVTSTTTIGAVPKEKYEWVVTQVQTLLRAGSVILARVYYVPPLRGLENPSLSLPPGAWSDLLEQGPGQYPAAVLATLAYKRKEYQPRIAAWTERVLSRKVSAEIVPGPQVEPRASEGEKEINLLSEGFGLNQLTFLFTQILSALPSSTIIIEEPEIHLHPKAQYELGALLVEIALQEGKQLVFTTHSEHFLFGVLSKVHTEKGFTNRDLRVYNFERKDSVASAQALTVSPDGKIREGLPGFFEVNLLELQETLAPFKE